MPLTLCKWGKPLNLVDYWVREQDPVVRKPPFTSGSHKNLELDGCKQRLEQLRPKIN